MSAPPVSLDVRPLTGRIGAEIGGVDLREPLGDDAVAAIRAALLRWKVVFFRGQHLTPAQHIAFGRRFGTVTPAHPTLPAAMPEHPEILVLDNEGGDGESRFENRWHTDATFVPNPPMASILRAVTVPDYGGDTQWTNLVTAYEELSEPLRELCDRLHAVHHNVLTPKRGGAGSASLGSFSAVPKRSVHPVVRVHPETGERALFVNPHFTSHIVELTNKESRYLLALLADHLASPGFTVRFHWEPGSIAFWDNRATAHLVPTDVPKGARRTMQRITLAGDTPVGPDGFRSEALDGGEFG